MKHTRPVYVVGHRNPDTDSVCSATVYAGFKRKYAGLETVAARCGEMNEETRFVLNHFGVQAPEMIEDVYVRLEHIMDRDARKIDPEQAVLEAGRSFYQENSRFFPVVKDNVLVGVISTTDLSGTYIRDMAGTSFDRISASLSNLVQCLEGRVLMNSLNRDTATGNVVVCAMATEILGKYLNKDSIALVGNRTEAQLAALRFGAQVLIVTGNFPVDETVLNKAAETGTILITTPHDTYTAARLVGLSMSIKDVMVRDIKYFYTDDTINEIKEEVISSSHRAYPVVGRSGRFKGVVSYSDLLNITAQQVILVDHNERSQSPLGIESAEVLEIIDHHRIGDVQTLSPIYMRNEPLGSTATVIAKIFREAGVVPEKHEAGLLLSAMLSDTLILKSPTTTREDRELAAALGDICGETPGKWGLRMLEKRTKWHDMEPEEFLKKDVKKYLFGKNTLAVAQVELLSSSEIEGDVVKEILRALANAEETGDFTLYLLMVTDIVQEGTFLLYNPEHKKAITHIFGGYSPDGKIFLEGVMSRKKQVVPLLNRYFVQD